MAMQPRFPLVAVASLAVSLVAQQPVLVKDINVSDAMFVSSAPTSITMVGGTVLLGAYRGPVGRELFRTSGQPGSTRLVADIAPGAPGSDPTGFVDIGSTIVFVADDGSSGRELWRTDGTAAGTAQVSDIASGSASAQIRTIFAHGGIGYFEANDGSGAALWRTDGTASGTSLLLAGGWPIRSFAVFAGSVHLLRQLPSSSDLWRTDGTASGTVPVASFNRRLDTDLVSFAGDLYIGDSDGLIRMTPAYQQFRVGPTESISRIVQHQGSLYFTANRSITANLWRSDGTTSGTQPVTTRTIEEIDRLTSFGNLLLFVGRNGQDGTELWATDGTRPGTVVISDVAAGPESGAFDSLAVLGGTAVFAAGRSLTNTTSLWRTDGTRAGTARLNVPATNPHGMIAGPGGAALFAASEPVRGIELWRTDGTEAGTILVDDIDPTRDNESSSPVDFVQLGSLTIFRANDGVHGIEPWVTDGTEAGTRMLQDIRIGAGNSNASSMVRMGGFVYFSAQDDAFGSEVWRTDGTPNGTLRISDINPGSGLSFPAELTPLNERQLVFRAFDPVNGLELWTTDGTTAGTRLLFDINPGAAPSNPGLIVRLGEHAFFFADDGVRGFEPWITDGTAANTRLVREVVPGTISVVTECIAHRGRAYFVTGPQGSPGLWVSDGTPMGTLSLGPVANPRFLSPVGSLVYFQGQDTGGDREVWVTDGSAANTRRLLDLGPTSSSPGPFVAIGDRTVFTTESPLALWSSDGTAAGTVQLTTLTHFPPDPPVAISSRQAWLIDSDTHLPDLWRTDGTLAGTSRVATGSLGRLSSVPRGRRLHGVPGSLLLDWTEPVHNYELYAIGLGATAQRVGHGCGDGTRDPSLDADEPVIGRTMALAGSSVLPGAAVVVVLGLPSPPALLTALPCGIHIHLLAPTLTIPAINTGGEFATAVPIPGGSELIGLLLGAQAFAVPGKPGRGYDATNGLVLHLGQ